MPFCEPVVINGVELDRSWIKPQRSARLHLLPAHQTPTCIVLRRKPSKLVHVMRWDTRRDTIEHGSWFRGTLYPMRCDLSWDGGWMIYLAMGADGRTWNGLCQPPRLKTVVDCPNVGTWAGGGVFTGRRLLEANTMWHAEESLATDAPPGGLTIRRFDSGGEDEPVLYRRLHRDGWRRRGANYGTERRLHSIRHRYFVANLGDDGWQWRPSRKHPVLCMWYRGYFERGRTFEFEIEGYKGLLDASVEWATWNCRGDLLVARQGRLQRYTLSDLKHGNPTFDDDLNALAKPASSGDETDSAPRD